jgi:hypothetical protein
MAILSLNKVTVEHYTGQRKSYSFSIRGIPSVLMALLPLHIIFKL